MDRALVPDPVPDSMRTLTVWGAKVCNTEKDQVAPTVQGVSKGKKHVRELFEQEYGKDEIQTLANECFDEMKENISFSIYTGCTEVVGNKMSNIGFAWNKGPNDH